MEGTFFPSILYAAVQDLYTLQQISPIEASQAQFLQLELPLSLSGQGVDVAIIDTGIDYLSEEFINENGETRIEHIWDQTVNPSGNQSNDSVPYGAVYTKQNIQDAINAFKEGKSPYEIVPSIDEVGHGTGMAGIIGARGKDPKLKGIAPECNFVVVKLLESAQYKKLLKMDIPIYELHVLFTALEYIYRYALINQKPVVIYFPIGSNLGSHKGNGILEQFMNSIVRKSGITIVTGAGNEAASGTHTSGIIPRVNESRSIQLYISPLQEVYFARIWIDAPNIMSVEIISPSGETTGSIKVGINKTETYSFLFENTTIRVNYYIPEENTGDELIRIRFTNVKEGIWTFRLTGESILDGKYNAWIPQAGISKEGSKFVLSDPYGTMMDPGTSEYVITAAAYNQNNNNILSYSGVDFLDNYISRIDVAAGGVNALTVGPNNTTNVVNGTSVSAAILAGTCVMLFEWGIVQGNDPNLYTQTLKTYIARGAVERSGDIYPNPEWGYGILNILKIFQSML